jgi:hypothetical protein
MPAYFNLRAITNYDPFQDGIPVLDVPAPGQVAAQVSLISLDPAFPHFPYGIEVEPD